MTILRSLVLGLIIIFTACIDSGNIYENLSANELGEMFPTTYHDVELTIEEDLAFDEHGTLFTGVRNTFDIESDLLTYRTEFLDGRPIQYEFFEVDENGVNRSKGLTKKSINTDGNMVSRYFNYSVNDSLFLASEIVESDSTMKYSLYYENGKLFANWMNLIDRETVEVKRHGLFTEYDEQGNLLKQERYEDGILIETIK